MKKSIKVSATLLLLSSLLACNNVGSGNKQGSPAKPAAENNQQLNNVLVKPDALFVLDDKKNITDLKTNKILVNAPTDLATDDKIIYTQVVSGKIYTTTKDAVYVHNNTPEGGWENVTKNDIKAPSMYPHVSFTNGKTYITSGGHISENVNGPTTVYVLGNDNKLNKLGNDIDPVSGSGNYREDNRVATSLVSFATGPNVGLYAYNSVMLYKFDNDNNKWEKLNSHFNNKPFNNTFYNGGSSNEMYKFNNNQWEKVFTSLNDKDDGILISPFRLANGTALIRDYKSLYLFDDARTKHLFDFPSKLKWETQNKLVTYYKDTCYFLQENGQIAYYDFSRTTKFDQPTGHIVDAATSDTAVCTLKDSDNRILRVLDENNIYCKTGGVIYKVQNKKWEATKLPTLPIRAE